MESVTIEQTQGDLAGSLFRIAANPEMVTELHQIMGGFCHQCRNTLNSLRLSLYLANRDSSAATIPAWSDLESHYRSVERMFDRLQTICRPMRLTPIRASLSLVIDQHWAEWVAAMGATGGLLERIAPAGPDVGDFDPIRLAEGLDAFVRWRAREGTPGQRAELRWVVSDGRFALLWSESGSSAGAACEDGLERADSLALPLLARVISAHGGTLDLSLRNGLHLGASWPVVARPTS